MVNKVNQKVMSINATKSQYEDTVKKLTTARVLLIACIENIFQSEEVTNRFGIAENSVLKVDIVEARDIVQKDAQTNAKPYAIVSVDDQQKQTKRVPPSTNPVWSEELTL